MPSWRALLALFVLLAGCTDPGHVASPSSTLHTTAATGAGNVTLVTLGPAVDPWAAGETERVLFDGTVKAGDCYTGAMAFEVTGGYVMGGCAEVPFEDGHLIPAGTGAIRFDVDVSAAVRQGSYYAFLYTSVRHNSSLADREATTEPVHSWTFPLVADEWDNPTSKWTHAYMGLWTVNSVLQGDVKMHVAAVRLANWTALPPVDQWRLPAAHRMPQTGVMTLLDTHVTWREPGISAREAGTPWPASPALADRVPAGTTSLVVAVAWNGLSGCDAEPCEMLVDLWSEAGYQNGYSRLADDKGKAFTVYVYKVPDEVLTDPDWRNATAVQPGFGFYTNPDQYGNCQEYYSTPCHPASDVQADLHILVEAWRGAVDLVAVKARLGAA
ncbi:MAG: hypothetical protein ABR562_02010 [Thermoplasmatota archaeon]|nr:hypothetical protein [Halobacteriales archaeon]